MLFYPQLKHAEDKIGQLSFLVLRHFVSKLGLFPQRSDQAGAHFGEGSCKVLTRKTAQPQCSIMNTDRATLIWVKQSADYPDCEEQYGNIVRQKVAGYDLMKTCHKQAKWSWSILGKSWCQFFGSKLLEWSAKNFSCRSSWLRREERLITLEFQDKQRLVLSASCISQAPSATKKDRVLVI